MSFEGSRAVLVKDLSGNILRISGGAIAVGGSISATSAISGQTIAVWGASGRNPTYITNQSGNVPANVINNDLLVAISDDGSNVASVAVHADNTTAFNALGTWATLFGWSDTQARFNRIRTTESGSAASASGISFKLLTATTLTDQSATRTANVTASGAILTATQNGSGFNAVYLTNQSGNVPVGVDSSGRLAINNPVSYTEIRIPATLVVTAASGGVNLLSGVADLVTIENIGVSGTAMFVGTSSNPPWAATIQSGFGFRLYNAGTHSTPQMITLPTLGNMHNIRVVSVLSGEPVSYIGVV